MRNTNRIPKGAKKTNIDYTAKIVRCVENSRGKKNPVQSLRPIKTVLKNIGFTIGKAHKVGGVTSFQVDYEKVLLKGDGRGTPNTHYADATILDMLRSYLTSVISLNIKNPSVGGPSCPIREFKNRVGNIITDDEAKSLKAKLPMPELRNKLKAIKQAHRGSEVLMNAYRAVRIENHGYYWILSCFKIINVDVKKTTSENRILELNNKLLINPDFLLNWSIDVLTHHKQHKLKLALALMAVTGRRSTEIMKTAQFTKFNNEAVIFSGQLKQKNRVQDGRGTGDYPIPTLCSADLVVSGLMALRSLQKSEKDFVVFMNNKGKYIKSKVVNIQNRLDIRHSEGVADLYNKSLSAVVKSVMNSTLMRPSLFRSAYTEIAYEKGMQNKGELRPAFRMRVLGHVDLSSQSNYEKFELSRDVERFGRETNPVGVEAKKSGLALVELLESHDETIRANTRAKSIHALQDLALYLAKLGELAIENVTVSWARKQILSGKPTGAAAAKQWIKILGL